MSDEPRVEPPVGSPGQRALGAMAIAVRRARESGASNPYPDHARPAESTTSPIPPVGPEDGPAGESIPDPGARGRRGERWLVAAVALAAVLVLAGAVTLAALPATSRRGAVATRPTVVHGGTHAVTRPTSTTGSRSQHPTAPTTTPAPAAATLGATPVISALNPASGVAGQAIGVSGANFLSANGQIVATFNGQVAPTSCPSPTTCSVTVPPLTQASVALVTITTSSGTSNAVHFTYG